MSDYNKFMHLYMCDSCFTVKGFRSDKHMGVDKISIYCLLCDLDREECYVGVSVHTKLEVGKWPFDNQSNMSVIVRG